MIGDRERFALRMLMLAYSEGPAEWLILARRAVQYGASAVPKLSLAEVLALRNLTVGQLLAGDAA